MLSLLSFSPQIPIQENLNVKIFDSQEYSVTNQIYFTHLIPRKHDSQV